MKKVLICGMLLGLLTSVSYAQRGRVVAPMARGGVSPNVVMPNTVGISHMGISPAAAPMPTHTPTVKPNATAPDSVNTVPPNAGTAPDHVQTVPSHVNTVPDRVMLPDAHQTGPNQ